jgi:hypothetical protein
MCTLGNLLINTPLQRGERAALMAGNRLSGFSGRKAGADVSQTAEAVQGSLVRRPTPLKRGVNERVVPMKSDIL